MAEAWGQLVSTADFDSEPVMLERRQFIIGRAPGSDLSFVGNKLISGKHCVIERDEEDKNWIQDFSTNGTLLNRRRKLHKEKVEINHGDEIFLVYRKDKPELNISFLFQDLECLRNEEPSSSIKSETDVATSDLDTSDLAPPQPQINKRKLSVSEVSGIPPTKRHRSGDSGTTKIPHTSTDGGGEGPARTIDNEKEEKKEGEKEKDKEENKEEKKKQECEESEDEIEESLLCIICQEIFYNCVSLQPCMHSYCAGCYSDWMGKSNKCPSCRAEVVRINKNHLVNNLVEAFLKKHPKKKRDPEELEELDKKNKITTDMLYPEKKRVREEESDEGSEEGSEEDDDDVIELPNFPIQSFGYTRINLPTRLGLAPPPVQCRQCPGRQQLQRTIAAQDAGEGTSTGAGAGTVAAGAGTVTAGAGTVAAGAGTVAAGAGTVSGAGPSVEASLPDVKSMPVMPDFTCRPGQVHIMCNCCLLRFPDRRADRVTNNTLPPVQCELCSMLYCHAYWGCTKACLGCLGFFKDMNFGRRCLSFVIMENAFESGVLENYMKIKSMSVKDVLKICLRRLQTGAYFTLDQRRGVLSGDTAVCYNCGLRNFKELVYQFRRDIPNTELPAEIVARPDCHWGKNCRTQKHNINHATRYNHICEQTAGLTNS